MDTMLVFVIGVVILMIIFNIILYYMNKSKPEKQKIPDKYPSINCAGMKDKLTLEECEWFKEKLLEHGFASVGLNYKNLKQKLKEAQK